ncbi:MAG: class I SAM-dependent DNA methyltransferase [Armatimonadota bacterium]
MERKDLQFADQFNAVAPYYDEVMSVVPYRQWVQYLRRLVKRFHWRPQHILEIATGTGTVALLLAQEGYRVTGIDISAPMIEIAQRKAKQAGVTEATFLCQDATQLNLPQEYDLAISLFDSLNYILTSKGLQDAFAGVHRSLLPGGGFIFDLNGEYALERNLFSQDNLWDENAAVKHIWTARYNPRTRIATVDMQFYLPDGRGFREVHKERTHRHTDVVRFLHEAGFEFLDAFDAYSFLPAGKRSERIFYVARKP